MNFVNIKEKLKSIGGGILGIGWWIIGVGILIGLMFLWGFILQGGLWIGGKILPSLIWFTNALTIISILVFIPLIIIKKTRIWGSIALFIASYLFGLTLWVYSALIAYILWGLGWLIVGLFLLGIGVLPIALISSLFSGEWSILWNLIYMIILTFGSRILSAYFLEKSEEQNVNIVKNNNTSQKRNIIISILIAITIIVLALIFS